MHQIVQSNYIKKPQYTTLAADEIPADGHPHDPKQDVYRALGIEDDRQVAFDQEGMTPACIGSSGSKNLYTFLGLYNDRISPRYFTSPLLAPATLGYCRLGFGLYAGSVVLIDIVHTRYYADLNIWFSYYTHITYIGLAAYFLFAGWHTLVYAKHGAISGLSIWSKPLQLMHMVLQHTVCAYAFLVTIVYWGVLAGDMSLNAYPLWVTLSMHALNTCFALFEIWFSRVTTRFALMVPSFLFVLLYLPVVYITYAQTKQWVYYFFGSPNPAIVTGAILGIGALSLLCNVAVQLMQAWRERIFGMRGVSLDEGQNPRLLLAPQTALDVNSDAFQLRPMQTRAGV